MSRASLAALLILSSLAVAAPRLETVDLSVGQRLELPAAVDTTWRSSDDQIVKLSKSGKHGLVLVGREAGKAIVTYDAADGRRTVLVRVRAAGPAEPAPAAPRGSEVRDAAAESVGGVKSETTATAGRFFGPPKPQLGLQVMTQANKARAVPDDVVTYTVVCRNLGPAPESAVVVEAAVDQGLDMVPTGLSPGAQYEPDRRRVSWRLAALPADQQSAFSFQARVGDVQPGDRVQAKSQVQSATMSQPRLGPPAAVEVVSVPLMAALAVPDVIIAQADLKQPLIDVETQPGQRLVERLEGLGVLHGYPDGSFKSDRAVTRAEATKMIVSVQQLSGLRDRTSITLALSRPATVHLTIDNSAHEVVRALATGWELPQGNHQVIWDGRDDQGRPAAMGVYRYQATAVDASGIEQTLDGTVHVVSVRPLPADLHSSFRDVKAGSWYYPYLAAAEDRGVVKGYPGGEFLPNQPIKRVEHTVMVVRAAGLETSAQEQMNASLGFADEQDVPRWAVGYVAVATHNGPTAESKLLIGYKDNRFLPEQNLSRGEAAATLERLVDHEGRVDITASGSVARGHALAINGREVKVGTSGRFRDQVQLTQDLDLVRVTVR